MVTQIAQCIMLSVCKIWIKSLVHHLDWLSLIFFCIFVLKNTYTCVHIQNLNWKSIGLAWCTKTRKILIYLHPDVLFWICHRWSKNILLGKWNRHPISSNSGTLRDIAIYKKLFVVLKHLVLALISWETKWHMLPWANTNLEQEWLKIFGRSFPKCFELFVWSPVI